MPARGIEAGTASAGGGGFFVFFFRGFGVGEAESIKKGVGVVDRQARRSEGGKRNVVSARTFLWLVF